MSRGWRAAVRLGNVSRSGGSQTGTRGGLAESRGHCEGDLLEGNRGEVDEDDGAQPGVALDFRRCASAKVAAMFGHGFDRIQRQLNGLFKRG